MLMEGNKSLLAKRNALRERSEDLESELTKGRSSAVEDIAALEARIKSVEAHSVDVAVAGENTEVILKLNLSRTWQSCAHCMNIMFKASEVYSCGCLKVNP
jgi:hypothetical protein